MPAHFAAPRFHRSSPLGLAQRRLREVDRRNRRVLVLALIGTAVVLTLAVLELIFATAPR